MEESEENMIKLVIKTHKEQLNSFKREKAIILKELLESYKAAERTLDKKGLEEVVECFNRQFDFQFGNIWCCIDCGEIVRRLWPITFRNDIGRCNDCQFKEFAREMPAPPIDELKLIKSGMEKGYLKWPHHYIPKLCPYCNQEVQAVFLGTGHGDHCYENHFCEDCKVFFGTSD